MQNTQSRLILAKEDYDIMMSYVKIGFPMISFNRRDLEELEKELKKAKVVLKEKVPEDVVRLNSTVTIKEEKDNKIMELTVVTPDKADIKGRLISVLSPIGTALIGFRKGQRVKWRVPAGNKTFTIMNVQHRFV